MAESQCLRIPLRPGKTDRFVAWLDEVRPRRAEMLSAMAAEGVIAETMALERGESGEFVVFYTRAESLERANRAFATSEAPIDVETRAIIAETWDIERAQALTVLLELFAE